MTDALRHSKVKLTWDQDDPNRAKITRRALTREEIEEEDFGGLVAASSDDESEEELEDAGDEKKKTKKQKMKERKDKLRALLLADDDETGDIWGKQGSAWQDELADIRGQDKDDADDMEITFKPGLSASGKAEENLTTLEKYQMRMKEKKAKKKEKIELKRSGGDVVDKEDAEDKIAGDDFFGGSDSEDEQPQTKSKIAKRSLSPVDMDDAAGLVEDQANHFNIKDHIASEKAAAKKRKRTRKSKKGERELELGPEGFKPEADSRFSAIYSEPAFALDPTHSKYAPSMYVADTPGLRISRLIATCSRRHANCTLPSAIPPPMGPTRRISVPSWPVSRTRWRVISARGRVSTRGCILFAVE